MLETSPCSNVSSGRYIKRLKKKNKKAADGDTWQGTEIRCSVFSCTELAIIVHIRPLAHSLSTKIILLFMIMFRHFNVAVNNN